MAVPKFGYKIGVLDTSISSLNLGDFIIMDAARKVLNDLFPSQQHVNFSTHDSMGRVGLIRQNSVEMNFLCGTNCLNSSMFLHRQWNVGVVSSFFISNTVPLGVGWGLYQGAPDRYTSWLLKKLISKDHYCSVRDNYTLNYLKKAGVEKAILTACPTMWELTAEHCKTIPTNKAEHVVFTLTDYRPDIINDKLLLEILIKEYKKIYFWPQGSNDMDYLLTIDRDVLSKVTILNPNLSSYDNCLQKDESIDYVGTRLHAGIRAMQYKRRAIIIGVDNRAFEKRNDFNLTVIDRKEIKNKLKSILSNKIVNSIILPFRNIDMWKSQFN